MTTYTNRIYIFIAAYIAAALLLATSRAFADIPAGNVFPNGNLETFTGTPGETTATPLQWNRSGSPGGSRYTASRSVSPTHSLHVTDSTSDFSFWWSNDLNLAAELPGVAFVNINWHQAHRVTNGDMRFSVILGQNTLTSPGPSAANFNVEGTSAGYLSGAFVPRTEMFYLPPRTRHIQLQVVSGGEGSATGDFFVDDISITRATSRTAQTLIPSAASWRYLDNGSNQGTAWRSPTFDDAAWKIGTADFGYGDGDEETVINCGPSAGACNAGNFAAAYFRRSFTITNLAELDDPTVFLARDDAAAVFVNGVEVFRDSGLPANAAFNTYATTNAGSDHSVEMFSFDRGLLRSGVNSIAVEVHQASPNSSDLSFDLQMEAEIRPIPEPASCAIAASAAILFGVEGKRRRRRALRNR
jgi:hypothetical protein